MTLRFNYPLITPSHNAYLSLSLPCTCPGQENATYSLHNIHMTKEWVLRLATHPKMLAPLKAILGPNLILLDSRFITKYPTPEDKDAFVAWHQDVR